MKQRADAKFIFALLAFLFSIIAYFPYIQSMLTGSRPIIATWISWWIMDVAILAAMITKGTIAYQMVAYVIDTTAVIAISVRKGAILEWTWIDLTSLAIVSVAVALWGIAKNPNITIVMGCIATVIGTLPMIVNIWHDPTHEPLAPWLLVFAGGMFGVLAIRKWNIAEALTPAVFLICQTTITLLILYRPHP